MAMNVENEIARSADCAGHATGAAEAGNTLRKYSDYVGNGNHDRGHNHVGKGSDNNNHNNKNNNNVIDILDLAVPRPKVQPIDRLLDRYDWSSTAMTPLLQQDVDRPSSRPGRPAPPLPRRPSPLTRTLSTRPPSKCRAPPPPSKCRAPPTPSKCRRAPPPPSPTRPPSSLDLLDCRRPVRKSLWKRAMELVSNCFVCAVEPRAVCSWSR